jgi:hypothetical protein
VALRIGSVDPVSPEDAKAARLWRSLRAQVARLGTLDRLAFLRAIQSATPFGLLPAALREALRNLSRVE